VADKATSVANILTNDPAVDVVDTLLEIVGHAIDAYEDAKGAGIDWSQLRQQRHAIPPEQT
jgi:hypothetical protein